MISKRINLRLEPATEAKKPGRIWSAFFMRVTGIIQIPGLLSVHAQMYHECILIDRFLMHLSCKNNVNQPDRKYTPPPPSPRIGVPETFLQKVSESHTFFPECNFPSAANASCRSPPGGRGSRAGAWVGEAGPPQLDQLIGRKRKKATNSFNQKHLSC